MSPRRKKLQSKRSTSAWGQPVHVAIFNPWKNEEKCAKHPGGRNVLYCLVESSNITGEGNEDSSKMPTTDCKESSSSEGRTQPALVASQQVRPEEMDKVLPQDLSPPGHALNANIEENMAKGTKSERKQQEIEAVETNADAVQGKICGNSNTSRKQVEQFTHRSKNFTVEFLDAAKIRRGELSSFDVVVFPGGSSALQAQVLGKSGRDAVRAFIASGGGFVGFCAGAFLALSHYCPERSLKIVSASVVLKREHLRTPNLSMYARQGKESQKYNQMLYPRSQLK